MKFLFAIAGFLSLAAAAPTTTKKGFTIAHAGSPDDIVLTEDNVVWGAFHSNETKVLKVSELDHVTRQLEINLPLELVNNAGQVNMYIQAKDYEDRFVFLSPDGSIVFPSSQGSTTNVPVTENIAHPIDSGATVQVTIPLALQSGRIYFAEGDLQFFMVFGGDGKDGLVQPSVADPNDPSSETNFGFAEFTITPEGEVWSNITFVDFVGLVVSMYLRGRQGNEQNVVGLPGNVVPLLCNDMADQSARDGLPWASECVTRPDGTPLRVISPEQKSSTDESAWEGYYNDYVNQVYERFANEPLFIDTQSENGVVECHTVNDAIDCAGSNKPIPKPSAKDIWGCDQGAFSKADGNAIALEVIPRLCAAFTRTTLLLPAGNQQPNPELTAESYYTVDPTSHYSRAIHSRHIDGRGYAFSYDDVQPSGAGDTSGLIREGEPELLRLYIGGSVPA